MVRNLLLLFIAVGMLNLAGCQNARYILKETDHGMVAIPNNLPGLVNHREKANELMQQHFPSGYEVVREEEVTVGAETSSHVGDFFSVTETHDTTEWRISYRRKDEGSGG
jgi:hypothetical protein